jgi:hypothetical protein
LAFAAEGGVDSAVADTNSSAATETAPAACATAVSTAPAAAATVTSDAAMTPEAATPQAAEPMTQVATLKGALIDNMCANANKANLDEFVTSHTKQCALMPGCQETGYSFYSEGKLRAFDKESNAKVVEFLKKPDSSLKVTITAKQVGDELSLVSIENR